MHRLLDDIPRFLILFLEELFLIFNQMLSIGSFGRRVMRQLLDNYLRSRLTYDLLVKVAHMGLPSKYLQNIFLSCHRANYGAGIQCKLTMWFWLHNKNGYHAHI